MQRRQLLGHAVAVLAVPLLSGCGTATNPTSADLASVINDVEVIAQGLLGVLPTIGTVPGLDPAMVANIGAAIGNLQTLAEQLKVVDRIEAAQPFIQEVEKDVNMIIGALAATALLPPPVSMALSAVAILLPVIEQAVHMLVPVTPKLAARAAQRGMTPDQARLTLRSLAPHSVTNF